MLRRAVVNFAKMGLLHKNHAQTNLRNKLILQAGFRQFADVAVVG